MDTTIESYLNQDASSTTSSQGLFDASFVNSDAVLWFLALSTIFSVLIIVALVAYSLRVWAVQKATLTMQKDVADIKKLLSESHQSVAPEVVQDLSIKDDSEQL